MSQTDNIHATAVVLTGGDGTLRAGGAPAVAILLRGPSGSGKSDLALRLIAAHGATLLADDRVDIKADGGHLLASVPVVLAGMLEVRGVGLLRIPYHANAVPVALVVDLVERNAVERLPEAAHVTLCNIVLPCVRLHAFEVSAVHKIIAALAVVEDTKKVVS